MIEVSHHRTEALWMAKCTAPGCSWHSRAYGSERSAKMQGVTHARVDHGVRWGDIDDWNAVTDDALEAVLATTSTAPPSPGEVPGGQHPARARHLAGRALAAVLLAVVIFAVYAIGAR